MDHTLPISTSGGILLGISQVRKTYENLQRRRAVRQGLRLHKVRRLDPLAQDYGKWFLEREGQAITPLMTLQQIEIYLTRGGTQE